LKCQETPSHHVRLRLGRDIPNSPDGKCPFQGERLKSYRKNSGPISKIYTALRSSHIPYPHFWYRSNWYRNNQSGQNGLQPGLQELMDLSFAHPSLFLPLLLSMKQCLLPPAPL